MSFFKKCISHYLVNFIATFLASASLKRSLRFLFTPPAAMAAAVISSRTPSQTEHHHPN